MSEIRDDDIHNEWVVWSTREYVALTLEDVDHVDSKMEALRQWLPEYKQLAKELGTYRAGRWLNQVTGIFNQRETLLLMEIIMEDEPKIKIPKFKK